MDDEEYLQPVLTSQEQEQFYKLETVPIIVTSLILALAVEVVGVGLVCMWLQEQQNCDTYFIYLYVHCAYWLAVVVTDHLVKAKHHKLRICGYLEFYQSTYQLIRAPLFIASLWNTGYLLLAAIIHQTHKLNYEEYCRASEWLTPINYTVLLSTVEFTIIYRVYINYLKRVLIFNRMHQPPDVVREEWLSSFTQDTYAGSGEVGYHHRGMNLEELLEKQADLIRYLKDHNVKLSHRMMVLVAQRRMPIP